MAFSAAFPPLSWYYCSLPYSDRFPPLSPLQADFGITENDPKAPSAGLLDEDRLSFTVSRILATNVIDWL
jgi:hypothetical protein